jgi:hypothetical protein
LLAEALVLLQEVGDKWGIADGLERLARVAVAQGQAERAAWLCGAAARLRTAIGAPLPPAERTLYESALADARTALGNESFAAAWAHGQALSLEQVIAAMQINDGQDTPPRTTAS